MNVHLGGRYFELVANNQSSFHAHLPCSVPVQKGLFVLSCFKILRKMLLAWLSNKGIYEECKETSLFCKEAGLKLPYVLHKLSRAVRGQLVKMLFV